jgi:hypothetical protein
VDLGSVDSELGGFSKSHGSGLAVPGEALLGSKLLVPREVGFSSSFGV